MDSKGRHRKRGIRKRICRKSKSSRERTRR
ncbi:hypothetical protein RDABS01_031825 [Bienertia sinuspersici]